MIQFMTSSMCFWYYENTQWIYPFKLIGRNKRKSRVCIEPKYDYFLKYQWNIFYTYIAFKIYAIHNNKNNHMLNS